MNSSTKIAIVAAAVVAAVTIAVYFMSAGNPAGAPQRSPSLPVTGAATPTAEFLKSHPDALADAQKRCDTGSGQDVVALCDVVHSAKASLMADKFRQGASGSAK